MKNLIHLCFISVQVQASVLVEDALKLAHMLPSAVKIQYEIEDPLQVKQASKGIGILRSKDRKKQSKKQVSFIGIAENKNAVAENWLRINMDTLKNFIAQIHKGQVAVALDLPLQSVEDLKTLSKTLQLELVEHEEVQNIILQIFNDFYNEQVISLNRAKQNDPVEKEHRMLEFYRQQRAEQLKHNLYEKSKDKPRIPARFEEENDDE